MMLEIVQAMCDNWPVYVGPWTNDKANSALCFAGNPDSGPALETQGQVGFLRFWRTFRARQSSAAMFLPAEEQRGCANTRQASAETACEVFQERATRLMDVWLTDGRPEIESHPFGAGRLKAGLKVGNQPPRPALLSEKGK